MRAGNERPAHQRPVGEDEGRVGRGHLRAEQQQRERHGRAERGEEREPLARAATARAGPGSRHGPSGRRAEPTSSSAAARWAVTDSPLLPRRTVSRPSQAWNPTSADRAEGRPEDRRRGRGGRGRPGRPAPRISKPMTAATVRWIHSIQAFGSSSGGRSWPWQNGQSGQPRPESVARTTTPIVTSTRAVARVSSGELLEAGHEAAILPRGPGAPEASVRPTRATRSALPCRHASTVPDGSGARRSLPSPRCSPARRAAVPAAAPSTASALRPAVRCGCRDAPPTDMPPGTTGHDPGDPAARHELRRLRQGADPVPLPRRQQRRGERARPDRQASRSTTSARTRRSRRDGRRRRSSGRSRTSAACTSSTSTCPRPARGAPSSRPRRPARPPRRSASPSTSTTLADRRRRRAGAGLEDPDLADVGGDVDADLDRRAARPGLLRDVRRRRARRAQAVRARSSRRRSSARARSAGRRSTGSSRSPRRTRT